MTCMDDWYGWLAWMTGMDDSDGWLAWMTGMDDWPGWLAWMTGMDDRHEWLEWMTSMDDWHGWLAWMTGMEADISYFYILITDGRTDGLTDGHWYPLSRYCDWKPIFIFLKNVRKFLWVRHIVPQLYLIILTMSQHTWLLIFFSVWVNISIIGWLINQAIIQSNTFKFNFEISFEYSHIQWLWILIFQ